MLKFRIPTPKKTTPKSIRFPSHIVSGIESAIKGTDANFTLFVISACDRALKDLK